MSRFAVGFTGFQTEAFPELRTLFTGRVEAQASAVQSRRRSRVAFETSGERGAGLDDGAARRRTLVAQDCRLSLVGDRRAGALSSNDSSCGSAA